MATPSSVTVVWRTTGEASPVLLYGPTPGEWRHELRGEAITRRVSADVAAAADRPFDEALVLYDEPLGHYRERDPRDPSPSTRPGTWQYEAPARGLRPASRYYYAIYDGDRLLAGGDYQHYFETSPVASTEANTRLWVVGDSGTGQRDQRMVFEAMQRFAGDTDRAIDAYLHLGDMAYGDGADDEFQRNFFEVYQPLLRNTVCWPTMGNHEGHTSRGISQFGPYYDAYVLPTAAEAGGVASGSEAYYSFDIGKIHFVCLDSHDLDRSPTGPMAQWLVADLEETHADWLIAFWHHPPYTKGSHDSDHETQLVEMRTNFMPLLEAYGVDLVLGGHSHIYERSMLIDGAYATPTTAEGVVLDDGDGKPDGDGPYLKSGGLKPHNGTVAIVAGHGGAGVGCKGTMPIMREIIVENGSLVLDVDGDTLTGTMINKRGDRRDHFQIVKRGDVHHSPLPDPWQPTPDPSRITERRIAWSAEDAGRQPTDWRLLGADAEMRIEQRPGRSFYHARLTANGADCKAIYSDFEGPIAECEAYLQLAGDKPAGVVIGWRGEEDYCYYEVDPAARRACFYRCAEGSCRLVTERSLDIDFAEPLKIELEPVGEIVEVQINDQIEYTINLDSPVPPGRVGVGVSAEGELNFAGFTIDKG